MRKQVSSLNELQGSRTEILEQEGLICAPLQPKEKFEPEPEKVAHFERHHSQFGKKLNSVKAKLHFGRTVTSFNNVCLNAKIIIT